MHGYGSLLHIIYIMLQRETVSVYNDAMDLTSAISPVGGVHLVLPRVLRFGERSRRFLPVESAHSHGLHHTRRHYAYTHCGDDPTEVPSTDDIGHAHAYSGGGDC